MVDPDYGEPLFGLLSTFDEEKQALLEQIDRLHEQLRWAREREAGARQTIKRDVDDRSSERERLVEWLDRRLEQQEGALTSPHVSQETKKIMEIEVSLIRRYREIITGSAHTAGTDKNLGRLL
jgi:hypothetical protein